MLKKLFSLILICVMVLSPAFLSGCVTPTTPPTTGGTGDDGTGDGTGLGDYAVIEDYLTGVKVTFNPNLTGTLSSEEETYISDIKSQSNLLSQEILVSLCAEYGYGVNNGGYRVYDDTEFYDLYDTGFAPFDSNAGTYGTTYEYTHKDAIREDVYLIQNPGLANETILSNSWNWTLSDVAYTAPLFIQDFLRDYTDSMQIAIYMIILGYDIEIISDSDYTLYNDYINENNLPNGVTNIDELKDYFAVRLDHVGLLEYEAEKLRDFILNVVIGETLVLNDTGIAGRIIDADMNGLFDAEEFVDDVVTNGIYDTGEKINDLNGNGIFDSGVTAGVYDIRGDYFKNYENTINFVVDNVTSNETRYPQIAGIQFIDLIAEDCITSSENHFPMPIGAQQFKSIILINNEELLLDSVWLAFESTRDFNLEISARFNKANEAGENNVVFDAVLDTITVNAGIYDTGDNDNSFLVDIDSLLNLPDVEDEKLQPFENNTENFVEPIMLNSDSEYINYFELEKAQGSTTASAKYADYTTDFFEIIFNVTRVEGDTNDDPINFEVSIFDIFLD